MRELRMIATGLCIALALYSLRFLLAGIVFQQTGSPVLGVPDFVARDLAGMPWTSTVRRVAVITAYCLLARAVWTAPRRALVLMGGLFILTQTGWIFSIIDHRSNAVHAELDSGGLPLSEIISYLKLTAQLSLTACVLFVALRDLGLSRLDPDRLVR